MALRKNDLVEMFEVNSEGLSQKFKKQILVPTGRGGVLKAADYIHANAVVSALKKFGVDFTKMENKDDLKKVLPSAYNFRLNMFTPCLSYRYDELKPKAQNELFDKKNWVATEKQNGVRGTLIHEGGKTYLFSRNYSDVDCSLLDYWANIYQFPNFPKGTVFAIDVEVKCEANYDLVSSLQDFGIATDSKLEAMSGLLQTYPETARKIQEEYKKKTGEDLITFRLIHPLYFNGRNFIKRKIGEGKQVVDDVIKFARQCGLNVKPIRFCDGNSEEKMNFVNTLIESGSEGTVFHNLDGYYCTSENRDRNSFVKLKRVVGSSSVSGMGDSMDGWISGFKLGTPGTANEGLVSAFEITCYVRDYDGIVREHVIAYVPNITREMQLDCTVKDRDGNPTLSEDYYGMVVEVQGQAISRVNRRITHARLLRFKPEGSKEESIYSMEWLESQMDNYHEDQSY